MTESKADFNFVGSVPPSKSLLNRALVVQSFFPDLRLDTDSAADDVRQMRAGLNALEKREVIDCGHAGTVLRFLALRAARIPGRHTLVGSERLFSRPQKELVRILMQLGCEVELEKSALKLRSWGWKVGGDALHISQEVSSQFASAVLLSAWQLEFPLFILMSKARVSTGYFAMTLKLCERLGMTVDYWGKDLRIPAAQTCKLTSLTIEPDVSCAFAVAALAAVSGRATITPFPVNSLQPDVAMIEILKDMGVSIRLDTEAHVLRVEQGRGLWPVRADLAGTPDLLPVLGALCALAQGESELTGLGHTVHKESDRLAQTAKLIRLTGREVFVEEDRMRIRGFPQERRRAEILTFDPDQDHRLAMAAAVLARAGVPLQVLHPEVVDKSFPGFWQICGLESLPLSR